MIDRRVLQFRIEHAGEARVELRLQRFAQPAHFGIKAHAPVQHRRDHVRQLTGVERHVKIAFEAIGQHEARVLAGNAQRKQLLIGFKARVHVRAERRFLRLGQSLWHDIARAGKIDVAPGLDRIGRQPAFDQQLLRQHAHVVKGDGVRLMLHDGSMAGGEHLSNELQIPFRAVALFKGAQRAALRSGNAR